MKPFRLLHLLIVMAVVGGVAWAGYVIREAWLRRHRPSEVAAAPQEPAAATEKVILSDQAIKNLALTARPLKPQTFWKSIQVPGMVVDRPGQSDRNIVAPVNGMVTKIAHLPGDMVRPGEVLVTLKLLSELLHQHQTDLFKASQDITLAEAQKRRLLSASNAIAETQMIEVENQITRLQVAVKAYRHELLHRGLSVEQVDGIATGKLVSEITIVVPPRSADAKPLLPAAAKPTGEATPIYEVQEVKVDLGQHVQAGQTLCLLANHQALAIEGRAFRDETPLLERSVKEGWPAEVDFQEDPAAGWPALDQTFRIRHMANTIDPVNRTFAFLMPLENQSRTVDQAGRTQMLWRFRPGQKVRVLVHVDKLDNVFVLPTEAVARDGAEAYIFTQNVNTFERKAVRVLHRDRHHVVIANDGSLVVGDFVAQAAAAQLNRMARAGSSNIPKGYHVHADGSLHKNEDEGK